MPGCSIAQPLQPPPLSAKALARKSPALLLTRRPRCGGAINTLSGQLGGYLNKPKGTRNKARTGKNW